MNILDKSSHWKKLLVNVLKCLLNLLQLSKSNNSLLKILAKSLKKYLWKKILTIEGQLSLVICISKYWGRNHPCLLKPFPIVEAWNYHWTENHIFQTSWKDGLFKKNHAGIWSFLYYRERSCFFFPKIWSYTLDGKWKMIFLKKIHGNMIFF